MGVKPLSNLVVFSDTHAGSALALCPADGVSLDDGGVYKPSKLQRKLWGMWEEFWGEWVPEATRGEPYNVVCNGDALDGVPHRSVAQITHNLTDQQRIAERVIKPYIGKAERYYHIRGTEAHVGKSGQGEEALARSLGAVRNEDGQYARHELWIEVGDRLVHFLHHVGVTGSAAYEATAVHKELTESHAEAARWGRRAPDCIVRSHRHRCIKTEIPGERGQCIAVVTPAWQAKTPFVYRIPGGRLATPQFGGILVRVAHGRLFVDTKIWTVDRPKVER